MLGLRTSDDVKGYLDCFSQLQVPVTILTGFLGSGKTVAS